MTVEELMARLAQESPTRAVRFEMGFQGLALVGEVHAVENRLGCVMLVDEEGD